MRSEIRNETAEGTYSTRAHKNCHRKNCRMDARNRYKVYSMFVVYSVKLNDHSEFLIISFDYVLPLICFA